MSRHLFPPVEELHKEHADRQPLEHRQDTESGCGFVILMGLCVGLFVLELMNGSPFCGAVVVGLGFFFLFGLLAAAGRC